ncbi:MAG: EAL domain-containing protein [Candidatus Weimeria sp.]
MDLQPVHRLLKEHFENLEDLELGFKSVKYYLFPYSSISSTSGKAGDCLDHFRDGEFNFIDAKAFEDGHRYLSVRDMIRKALDEDRIEVFYQPIYDVDSETFRTAEALVRLRKEDGSLMQPGEFIPVAEESGYIRSLGLRVLKKVCAMIERGAASDLGLECIHVNLSAVQLDDPQLARQIRTILLRHSIRAGQINFEITESAKIKNKRTAYSTLGQIAKLGMPLSLDDFGTGWSNLDYLINLPISVVKFDRNFTNSYFSNKKARYVMQSNINMFHNLGISVVIEGIETKEAFDQIRKQPISGIQGYYFSQPLPEVEFLRFLESYREEQKTG